MTDNFDYKNPHNITTGRLLYSDELPFFDMISFCMFLGTTPTQLQRILGNIDSMYSRFYIDKDTGRVTSKHAGLRLREINAPLEPLKTWQLRLLDVLNLFPKHEANTAFMEGCSVINAAKTATKGDVLVHVDIKDFFPSHTALYIKRKLAALVFKTFRMYLPEEVLVAITKLICYRMQLPQGSPCSPMATIVLNYDLDTRIDAVAKKYNLEFKRYADDMWFTGVQSDDVIQEFLYELQDAIHPFSLNYKKTNIMRTRAYPKFNGVRIKFNKSYVPSTQAAKIINMVVAALGFTKHKANISKNQVLIEGYPTPQLALDDVRSLMDSVAATIMAKYPNLVFTCKPNWYYIQSTKKCLGLNIVGENVVYPRKRYNDLRLEAMLMGRQRALFALYFAIVAKHKANPRLLPPIKTAPFVFASRGSVGHENFRNLLTNPFNRRVFMGKVAYLRSINPEKADKIMAIEKASYQKCIDGYLLWYPTVNVDYYPDVQWLSSLRDIPNSEVCVDMFIDSSISNEELSSILGEAGIGCWAL